MGGSGPMFFSAIKSRKYKNGDMMAWLLEEKKNRNRFVPYSRHKNPKLYTSRLLLPKKFSMPPSPAAKTGYNPALQTKVQHKNMLPFRYNRLHSHWFSHCRPGLIREENPGCFDASLNNSYEIWMTKSIYTCRLHLCSNVSARKLTILSGKFFFFPCLPNLNPCFYLSLFLQCSIPSRRNRLIR